MGVRVRNVPSHVELVKYQVSSSIEGRKQYTICETAQRDCSGFDVKVKVNEAGGVQAIFDVKANVKPAQLDFLPITEGGPNLSDGKPHHMVVSYDSSHALHPVSLFADGELMSTTGFAQAHPVRLSELAFGGCYGHALTSRSLLGVSPRRIQMLGKRKADTTKDKSWLHAWPCHKHDTRKSQQDSGDDNANNACLRVSVHDQAHCGQPFFFAPDGDDATFSIRISKGLGDDKQPAFSYLSAW